MRLRWTLVMVVVGTLLGGALSCGAAPDRAPRTTSAPNEPQNHRALPVASSEPLLVQTELTAEELAALDPLEDIDTNFQLGALLPLLSGGGELACSSGPPSVTPDPTCAGPEAAVARLASTLATEAPVPAWASEMTARCTSAWSSQKQAARFRRDFYARDRAARRRFDATLASLEGCGGFQPGIVRLLRAHFFPECAPQLARETLGDNRVSRSLRVALAGLALRARLAAALRVPEYDCSMSAEQVERYVTRKLAPWVRIEAAKLDTAGQQLTLLPKNSYGRAVAAIALSTRWAKLRDSVALRNLERPAARKRFVALSVPLLEELARAGRAPAADAARSVLVATDWALVVPWTRELKGGLLSSAQDVVLPALKSPFELSDARRIWALVPSYVAARLVSGDKLDLPTLRALATAGLDPTLRRALAGPARLSPAIAEVVAHERMLLALRAFDPAQAREANRLLDVAASRKAARRPLAALNLFVAASPVGLEGWASSSGLSGGEILVRVAGDSTLSPTERALLKWDALMLSGVYGNDLRVGDSALSGDASRSIHDADIALGECQTGALFPKRCGCPCVAGL